MNGRIKQHFIAIFAMLLSAAAFIPAAQAAEPPTPAEKNPPGDIPDSQVFVTYKAPFGLLLKVPEGWARTERPIGVRFTDKFNIVDLALSASASAPTVAMVKTGDAANLSKTGRAVKITAIQDTKLHAGPAILVTYSSNSEPNPVTHKQLRLEHNRYLLYRHGKLAILDLSAPQGADNADQWRLMANSLRWN